MATKKSPGNTSNVASDTRTSSPIDEMLLAAIERGSDSLETGRFLVTFKEGAAEEGIRSLGTQGAGLRVADARDFEGQAATLESVGDADAVVFPEIGVALLGGDAAQARNMSDSAEIAFDSPIQTIEPELFVFSQGTRGEFLSSFAQETEGNVNEYLRGFLRATETIAHDLRQVERAPLEAEEGALALGATWGLNACKVPPSSRSGTGIKVAVLDTGMDLGHPDFVGRPIVSSSFVGQPVHDLHSHGTHCIGTSCGPKSPPGTTPRYGLGFQALIHVGKVLSNSGSSVGGSVLAGMNWAIANRCEVISMSLGSQSGVKAAYTAAGNAALGSGCLIIAAAGNAGALTGSPANSPSIMSVASLDSNMKPSSFSNFGKIEIAGPGRDVYSSVPRPTRYGFKSGTSMATPHVAGCAALWAETSPNMRGMTLWNKLRASAKRLAPPSTRVGAGLVQAP